MSNDQRRMIALAGAFAEMNMRGISPEQFFYYCPHLVSPGDWKCRGLVPGQSQTQIIANDVRLLAIILKREKLIALARDIIKLSRDEEHAATLHQLKKGYEIQNGKNSVAA
jgi:hypothetical protein